MLDESDYSDEMEELEDLSGIGFPKPKEKQGIWSFFNKILKLKDSTKTGYLDDEELRVARLLKSAALYSQVWNLNDVSDYLKNEAEVILSTSDSKSGFLLKTAVTTRRQLEKKDREKVKAGGFKSWFKKEQTETEEA